MASDRNNHNSIGIFILILGFCLISGLIALSVASSHARQKDPNLEWKLSGDPCYPVEQIKKYWRDNYHQEADFLQCVPLNIITEWDIEDSYFRASGIGDDRVSLLLRDEFSAYLELNYDQEDLTRLEAFNILGPAPCCPGGVNRSLERIDAALLICNRLGQQCRMFTTSDNMLFVITPQKDSFFTLSWRADDGNTYGDFGSSDVQLNPNALPRSMSTRRGIGDILHGDHFSAHVDGRDGLNWEDIQIGLEEGELKRDIPVHVQKSIPPGDHYRQDGLASITIQFGEEEYQRWRIDIKGWERDATQPHIDYTDSTGELKQIPVAVEYQWVLQGEFEIGKRKNTWNYKNGMITKADLAPELMFNQQSPYTCDFTVCPDQTDIQASLQGAPISGRALQGRVQLNWPPYRPTTCVVCYPNVSYLTSLYQQQFGTREFMRKISEESIPLQDGYVITRTIHDWLRYTIKLTRLN
jgi:hypothetical protein